MLALAQNDSVSGVATTLTGALGLAALAFGLLRPLLARMLRRGDSGIAASTFVWIVIGALAFAAIGEWIGLHAIFGAFLFGAALPRDDRLLHGMASRLEPVTMLLLLPVLFAVAGQSATPDALDGSGLGFFLAILLVAVLGKLVGCTLGAKSGATAGATAWRWAR